MDRAVIHKKERILIGEIGCKGGPNEEGIVGIGYGIVPEYRGKGYATEVTKAIVSWLFSQYLTIMVTADCRHDNIGSQEVLEKAGFE